MNKNYVVVEFESVWNDGTINTEAKYDYINNRIFDIVPANNSIELNGLVCENIIYDDESYELDKDNDNEYLLCESLYAEFKNINPKLFAL